jgi:hypothetical protein
VGQFYFGVQAGRWVRITPALTAHEVHRPDLVRPIGRHQRPTLNRDTLAPPAPLHLQTLLAVQPMHALDVGVLALAPQQLMDSSVAKAPTLGREADYAPAQGLPPATGTPARSAVPCVIARSGHTPAAPNGVCQRRLGQCAEGGR